MEINDNLLNYSPLSVDSHPLSEPCASPAELINELYDSYFDEHTSSPLTFSSSELSTSSTNGSEQTSPTEVYKSKLNVNTKRQKTTNKLTQNGAKKTSKTKKTRTKTLPKKFPLFISPNLPTEEELSLMNQEQFAKFWEKLKEYPLADQERLRHIKRRIKNRESASASRMRKRTHTEELEKVNNELENEKNHIIDQFSFVCNEREAFRQHAQALYDFAVLNGLTFDCGIEQTHKALGLKVMNNEPNVASHMNSLNSLNEFGQREEFSYDVDVEGLEMNETDTIEHNVNNLNTLNGFGQREEFSYDVDAFVEDQVVPMNGITIPTGTEEDELQYTQMNGFFGSLSTKFTVLSIFAIAALVLCVSAPTAVLLRADNNTKLSQTQTQTQIQTQTQMQNQMQTLQTLNPTQSVKESFRSLKGIRKDRSNELTDALVEVRHSKALVNKPPNIISEALIQSLSQKAEREGEEGYEREEREEKNLYQLEELKNSQMTLSNDCIRICRYKNEHDKQSITENALEIRDPFLVGFDKAKVELPHTEQVFLRQLTSQAHNVTYIYANQYTFLNPDSESNSDTDSEQNSNFDSNFVDFDSSSMIGILLPESNDSYIEIVARVTDGHRIVRNSEGEFAPI